MNIRFLNIVLALIIFYSCSDKYDTARNQLKVSMKVLVEKDVKFQLFYCTNYSGTYEEEHSQTISITGIDSLQDVSFLLPEGSEPLRIRIDLGENRLMSKMYLKEISFTNGKKVKSFTNYEIAEMFKFNDDAEFIQELGMIKFNNSKDMYDPYLISKNIKNIFD